jgi:hypothetical protein
MKCGTSSLYSYLSEHPEVCASAVKEPEFFSEHQGHKRAVVCYQDLWAYDHRVHKYAMEASTGYTKFPAEQRVPRRMHEAGIRPRLIYIVRDPFDRIVSHYNFMQNKPHWKHNITDVQLTLTSNYFIQLQQFREFYSRDSILVLEFDDLRDHPKAVLQTVYKFLGLSEDYYPSSFERRNVTRRMSKVEAALRNSGLKSVGQALPGWMKTPARIVMRNVAGPPKRTLTEMERRAVHVALSQDMLRFGDEYGIDVAKWGFGTSIC